MKLQLDFFTVIVMLMVLVGVTCIGCFQFGWLLAHVIFN